VFDRYFHLTVPEGDISQAQLDRILSLAGNREGLVSEFRALNERELLGVLLDRLEAYKQKIDISNAVTFVTALFDIGDELPDDHGGFFTISPEMHADRIIYWYLKQEEDIGKRGEILKEAMKATTGLYLPIRIGSLDVDEERKKNSDVFNVTDADLEELHRICVEKIEQVADSEILASHPKMLHILYRWREWASPEKPLQWVERLIASIDGVLSFLTACLHRSTSHGMEDYVSQEHWRINLKTIEDFVSVDALERKVAELSCENLSDNQKKAVEAFQKAIKRRQEGRSDDDWHHEDDE
jgi:predicted KAP-like P-loop ATPase